MSVAFEGKAGYSFPERTAAICHEAKRETGWRWKLLMSCHKYVLNRIFEGSFDTMKAIADKMAFDMKTIIVRFNLRKDPKTGRLSGTLGNVSLPCQ